MAHQQDNTTERWLPVVGYEGRYEVSDLGRVRSLDRLTVASNGRRARVLGRILRPAPDRKGYLQLQILPASAGRRSGTRKVHHLVLEAFVGPSLGRETRHLDGARGNNSLENLSWGTAEENTADKIRHGTMMRGEGHANSKLNAEAIKVIRHCARQGARHRVLAGLYRVSRATVSMVALGKRWAAQTAVNGT
jgi:NUMOD4 motif-containing protein/HNH endonuclease